MHVSGITYTLSQKTGKWNNLKVFGSKKTTGPKRDDQNQLRSPMSNQLLNDKFQYSFFFVWKLWSWNIFYDNIVTQQE